MLTPTVIMGVIAITLLYIGYQRGVGEHVVGLKSAGNLLLQILPLLIFAFIVAVMIQVLIPKGIDFNMGRHRIRFSRCSYWLSTRRSHAGWPDYQPARRRRAAAGRSKHWHNGRFPYGMVTSGTYQVANGNRYNGLEICLNSPVLCLLLSADCRANRQQTLLERSNRLII